MVPDKTSPQNYCNKCDTKQNEDFHIIIKKFLKKGGGGEWGCVLLYQHPDFENLKSSFFKVLCLLRIKYG